MISKPNFTVNKLKDYKETIALLKQFAESESEKRKQKMQSIQPVESESLKVNFLLTGRTIMVVYMSHPH